MLADADWQAKWIAASDTNVETLLLRREFTVKPGLRRATDSRLAGWANTSCPSTARKSARIFFRLAGRNTTGPVSTTRVDLSASLQPGRNAVGLFPRGAACIASFAGPVRYSKFNGSFGPLKAIAQLRLEYAGRLGRNYRHG